MNGCHNTVIADYRRSDGSPIEVQCNSSYAGRSAGLCETCQLQAEQNYPQGWRYFPGDTCKHGVYVGGCGADYMCGRCEAGA